MAPGTGKIASAQHSMRSYILIW